MRGAASEWLAELDGPEVGEALAPCRFPVSPERMAFGCWLEECELTFGSELPCGFPAGFGGRGTERVPAFAVGCCGLEFVRGCGGRGTFRPAGLPGLFEAPAFPAGEWERS